MIGMENRLEAWRKAKGVTYQALADRVGIPHAANARAWCLPFDHKDFRKPPEMTRHHLQELTGGSVVASWWLSYGEGAKKKESPSAAR
jgi:transcriptional regulator with XRE-family HTH domain